MLRDFSTIHFLSQYDVGYHVIVTLNFRHQGSCSPELKLLFTSPAGRLDFQAIPCCSHC